MRMKRHRGALARTVVWIWMALLGTVAGCTGPEARSAPGLPAPVLTANSPESGPADLQAGITEPAASGAVSDSAEAASLVETWVVHTRACEQKIGTDPWASITVGRFDGLGMPLHGTPPEALLERMAGRTSVFLIHGYGYSYRAAVEEAVTVRGQLEGAGGLPPETVFIVFDWPSERELRGLYADLNEKSRRTRIAAFHLARFLQESPPGSRVCLLGQSDGGRLALSTMHLLSGAVLPADLRRAIGAVERGTARSSISVRDRGCRGGASLAQSRRAARSGASFMRSTLQHLQHRRRRPDGLHSGPIHRFPPRDWHGGADETRPGGARSAVRARGADRSPREGGLQSHELPAGTRLFRYCRADRAVHVFQR